MINTDTLAVPLLAARGRDQRLYVFAVLGMAGAGFIGSVAAPLASVWLWAVLLGFGLGGCFGLGLTLIVLRAGTPVAAAALSGMAQSFGYLLAALGPFGVGLIYQVSGSWGAPTAFYTALALLALLCGWKAGRDGSVLSEQA